MAKRKSKARTGNPKARAESEPLLGLLALGLREDQVAHFLVLYRKFQESWNWVLEHPDQLNKALEERFFSTVVEPMDDAWEQMSLDTRLTLIRRKVV